MSSGAASALAQKAEHTQRTDESSTDDLDQAGESGGLDDDVAPEPAAARQRYLLSSIGVSVLSPAEAGQLQVHVRWGDYHRRSESPEEWARVAREEVVNLNLAQATERAREVGVPSSQGLRVAYLARRVGNLAAEAGVPAGARTISVFLVNRRTPAADDVKDEAFALAMPPRSYPRRLRDGI